MEIASHWICRSIIQPETALNDIRIGTTVSGALFALLEMELSPFWQYSRF